MRRLARREEARARAARFCGQGEGRRGGGGGAGGARGGRGGGGRGGGGGAAPEGPGGLVRAGEGVVALVADRDAEAQILRAHGGGLLRGVGLPAPRGPRAAVTPLRRRYVPLRIDIR
jgi:hypothetical protein